MSGISYLSVPGMGFQGSVGLFIAYTLVMIIGTLVRALHHPSTFLLYEPKCALADRRPQIL